MKEIVIKIPDEVKQAFDNAENNELKCGFYDHGGVVASAIKNGTELPEDFSLENYEQYKKDSENLSWIKCPERMGN